MAGSPRKGTVRPGWNVDEEVAERVRAGAAARGVPANDYLERAVRLVAQMQEIATEEMADADLDQSERWASNLLELVGLTPVMV